jgi:urea transport system permease protein
MLVLMLACSAAHAASLDEALEHFLNDDFTEVETGIGKVAGSGDPQAATILEALKDERLFYSAEKKAVFYKDSADKLFDAAAGRPADGGAPADLAAVDINNRLRGVIDAAIGGLTLRAPSPAGRYDGALGVFIPRP